MATIKCGYQKEFKYPNRTVCGAYADAKRADGKLWQYYPKCEDKNCPLRYPELLDGATLNSPRTVFIVMDE